MLKSDSVLGDGLPDAPTISLRRAPTLNDKLVKSHLAPYDRKPDLPSEDCNHKCGTVLLTLHLVVSIT